MHRQPALGSACVFWRTFAFAVLLAGSSFTFPSVRAATITWAYSGTDFTAGGSWIGGVAPGVSDTATFTGPGSSSFQPTLSASASVNAVSFSSVNSGWALSGGSPSYALTLLSNGTGTSSALFSANTTGTNTINVPLILAGSTPTLRTNNYADAGTLVLNGSISSQSGGAMTLNLGGRMTLNAASTYTGTTVFNGTSAGGSYISIGNKDVFGTSTLVFAGAGGSFIAPLADLTGANKFMNSISFTGTSGFRVDGPNNIDFGGTIAVSAGVTATLGSGGSGNTTFSGVVRGSGEVDFDAAPSTTVIQVTGTNTFTGNVTLSSAGKVNVSTIGNSGTPGPLGAGSKIIFQRGTLQYTGAGETTNRQLRIDSLGGTIESSGSGPLVFTAAIEQQNSAGSVFLGLSGTNTGNNTFQGVISGTGYGVDKTGPGLWILSGVNTYTGTTKVEEGTLKLSGAGTIGTGALQVTGGTLDLNSTTAILGSSFTLSGGTVTNGAINAASYVLMDGSLNVPLGGGGTLTMSGLGSVTFTLTTINSYSGKTAISSGTLSISSIGNVGGGNSSLGAPTTIADGTIDFGRTGLGGTSATGTLLYTGPTVSTDRVVNIAGKGGVINSSGSGPMTWTSGATASASGNLTLTGSTAANVFGAIQTAGPNVALIKDGTGSWGLSAANSYTGGTTITDGVLYLLGLGDLGSPTATVTVNNTARLNLNGRSVSIGAFGGTGTIVNDATGTAVTLSIGNSSNTGENGTIADHTTGTGTIAVAKVGTGTFTMYGNNSYTGGTTVEAGTLAVGNNPALGTGGVQVGASGALTLLSSISINNSIDLYGRLNGPGPGTPGATAGAVVLNSGGVVAPNFSVLTLGSLTWNGGGKVSIQLGGGSGASDRVAITGQLARGTGSGFVFDFNNTGGGALDPSVYTLLSFGSLNGFTAGDASPFSYINLGAGRTGSFTLTSTSLLFTSTAIPEPSTYAAIAGGLALAGVLVHRRRQKRRA